MVLPLQIPTARSQATAEEQVVRKGREKSQGEVEKPDDRKGKKKGRGNQKLKASVIPRWSPTQVLARSDPA